ncbi:unnamed protein product [Miscanthus lutarioriparius]|uniref:Aminotransferase class I/classII large domain-containing protein n=1 Tax=Miscanthus lutarioriparius TaxID=422564 RepID=A0A811QHX4_9POAL|nr:unnamed protein product [Miscanthus lutarioriparius]
MEENGGAGTTKWSISRPSAGTPLEVAGTMSIRAVLDRVFSSVDGSGPRPVLTLGSGDPTASPCFRPPPEAEDAIVEALRSGKHNGYSPTVGVLPARRAIAEYLSRDLSYQLSPDNIYLTAGCCQAIEVIISVLAQPGSNVLLPKPGFPLYESRTMFSNLEARHFNLIPDRGWEADLESLEALADENTVAMVIINPSNPCGSVYSYDHLAKIMETARKLGIIIIADEVDKLIENYINITNDPATFIQGAVPQIIANTKEDYFNKILNLLRNSADLCYNKIKETRGITCPHKPEGSMFVMVKLDLSWLDGIQDDLDFCCRLAKEDSVIVLPGSALGMKDWIRINFATDVPTLENALERIKSFCQRHAKLQA